jgi:hypothetical protein
LVHGPGTTILFVRAVTPGATLTYFCHFDLYHLDTDGRNSPRPVCGLDGNAGGIANSVYSSAKIDI